MDYEQKYKKALGWIRSIYPTMQGAEKEDAEHFFPELKESDEMIKERLLEYFKGFSSEYEVTWEGLSVQKIISWLEKQDQKPTKFKIGDLVEKRNGDIFHNGSKFAQITKIEIEKDPEHYWFDCGSWLYAEDIKLWKPAWSEEDEANMDAIWKACGIVYGTKYQSILGDWLKSIKPQPRWKPTKEQMEALKYFISFHKPQANAAVEGWKEFKNLESLYNDLKSL